MNPNDGKITPYYALSIIDKWIYKDVKTLLASHCPDLFESYIKILDGDVKNTDIVSSEEYAITLSTYVTDTNIYSPSRIIRSFQYLTEVNVIREWEHELLNVYRMRIE